jgi:7-cyano-7-deazaguanine reductase
MMKSYNQTLTYQTQAVDVVDPGVLDPIDYTYHQKRDILVTIRQPEFTSLCPLSGLPDFGTITVRYVPEKSIVELKSLKYYLLQYRNVGMFYEHVTNRILDDLVAALNPKWMCVTGEFTARGGLLTTVQGEFKGSLPGPP